MTKLQKIILGVVTVITVMLLFSVASLSQGGNLGGVYSNVQKDFSEGISVDGTTVINGSGSLVPTVDMVLGGTTPSLTIGDAGEEDAQVIFDGNAQDFSIGLDDSVDDLVISLGTALGTTNLLSFTDTGVATHTGSTDGSLTIYGAGTTASDAYLYLIGDAGADTSDSWRLFNDSSAAGLLFQSDPSVAGTYATAMSLTSAGALTTISSIKSSSASAGIGYATGAGCAVTQITNRSTGVTCTGVSGAITTDTTSLAAEATAKFTVTDTSVAVGDTVVVSQRSGSNSGGTIVHVTTVAAGSFEIAVHNGNIAAGTAETGAIIINFAVIKAVSS